MQGACGQQHAFQSQCTGQQQQHLHGEITDKNPAPGVEFHFLDTEEGDVNEQPAEPACREERASPGKEVEISPREWESPAASDGPATLPALFLTGGSIFRGPSPGVESESADGEAASCEEQAEPELTAKDISCLPAVEDLVKLNPWGDDFQKLWESGECLLHFR